MLGIYNVGTSSIFSETWGVSHRRNSLRYSDSNLHTYVTVKSLKWFVGDSARTPKGKGFGVANMTYMKNMHGPEFFSQFNALSLRMRNGLEVGRYQFTSE